MKTKYNLLIGGGALALTLAFGAGTVSAQGAQQDQTQQKPTLQKDKQSQAGAPSLEGKAAAAAAPVANPAEDADFKTFSQAPAGDWTKKLQLGEEFASKYPRSRYLSNVYSSMVVGYYATNQAQKLMTFGEKEIALNPNDQNVLAMMSQVLVRTMDPKAPTAAQTLDKVEQYGKHAIEVTITLAKPENLTDEAFAAVKGEVLSMAHSSLGVAYVRRGKYADAISELDQSVKLTSQPDPVNFYLLGIANEKTSHFDDAVAAFTKCAEMPGPTQIQNGCKQGVDEAKKLATTQLSAPK